MVREGEQVVGGGQAAESARLQSRLVCGAANCRESRFALVRLQFSGSPFRQAIWVVSAMATKHEEFGHCDNDAYRLLSRHPDGTLYDPGHEHEAPLVTSLQLYCSYLLMIVIGHVRDFFGKRLRAQNFRHLMPSGVSSIL